MVKRKSAVLTAVFLAFVLLCPLTAAADNISSKTPVVDQAGLFTDEQETVLARDAKTIGNEYELDIVIVTTEDAEGKSSREYADDFFDYNGYGVGEERNGILFLIDLDNREAYISTSGSGIRYLTDDRIEGVLDAVYEGGLADGDMYGAAAAFLATTGEYIAADISAGEPVENTLSTAEGIAGAGAGLITGLGFYVLTRKKYRGKPRPGVFQYRVNSHLDFSQTADNLVNTYVTSRAIPKTTSSSGGSTVHHSSSGRTHGGGGRKF